MSYVESKDARDFLTIVPRDGTYLDENISGVSLIVDRDKGVEVNPDYNVNVTNMNQKSNDLSKNFYNQGYSGLTFKIDILVEREQEIHYGVNKTDTLRDFLHYLIKNMVPVMVTTRAMDIPNGLYIIKDNNSRKQSFDKYSGWSLEFTTYNPITTVKYANNNKLVLSAIANAKKAQKKKKTKKTSSVNSKLGKCKLPSLKYSKTKKNVTCVKYLQQVLKKKKVYTRQIDGWYGPYTLSGVKKFQKNYNKKNTGKSGGVKLKVNGKIDKNTLKYLTQ